MKDPHGPFIPHLLRCPRHELKAVVRLSRQRGRPAMAIAKAFRRGSRSRCDLNCRFHYPRLSDRVLAVFDSCDTQWTRILRRQPHAHRYDGWKSRLSLLHMSKPSRTKKGRGTFQGPCGKGFEGQALDEKAEVVPCFGEAELANRRCRTSWKRIFSSIEASATLETVLLERVKVYP